MLELEMQKLREEIAGLRATMDTLSAVLLGATHAMLPTKPETDTGPAPEPVEATPAPAPAPAPLTVDDVQALCSVMVQNDANIKPKIKALIATFDGAKTLSKVPAHRLPELKAALEAMQ
jgi:hypothetical protein